MDKVYMNGKDGIILVAFTREKEEYLRICPIIQNSIGNTLFKVEYSPEEIEVKTDYFIASRFNKKEAESIRKAIIKAVYDNAELITLMRRSLAYVFQHIYEKPFNERTMNEENICMILDTKFYNMFIKEI